MPSLSPKEQINRALANLAERLRAVCNTTVKDPGAVIALMTIAAELEAEATGKKVKPG